MPPAKLSTAFARPANSFLTLDENRFACAALHELQRQRTEPASQLVFLYGPSGVGKTHLALQFLRDFKQHNPRVNYLHVTAGRLAAELAEASESKTIPAFAGRYREVDVLVCEDVSELERRPETQTQLVHILDEIRNAGGRVLITCKKMPGELEHVFPRLVNRCHAGVCAAVRLPRLEARRALLRHFAESRQLPLPQDVIQLLAKCLPVSPRELLAAVIKLETLSRLERSPVTLSLAQWYLDSEVCRKEVALSQISRAVARQFNISVSRLRAPDRRREHTLQRQCAMYVARRLTSQSLQRIAEYYGRTHYSTVIHACKGTAKRLSHEPALRQDLSDIYQKLGVNPPPEDE